MLRQTPIRSEILNRNQVVRLRGKDLYRLSHSTNPSNEFISSVIFSRVLFENILLKIMNAIIW